MIHLLFISSIVIQIVFLFLALKAFKKLKYLPAPTLRPSEMELPVSIIVCAHNEMNNLIELLPLLSGQDYAHKEILIVNDRSTDGTQDFLETEVLYNSSLKIINLPEGASSGKKLALQAGVLQARHDIILLTDADCRPKSTRWIQAMCQHFGDEKVQIVLGYAPYFKQKGWLNAFIQYETCYTAMMYISAALLGFPYMGVGRNLAYRKSVFNYKNGFNKHANVLGGDDDLFVNQVAHRRNTRVALAMEAQVQSVPQKSWKGFLNQKHRHLEAGKLYKFTDRIWLGTAVLSHLFFWICFCILLFYNFGSPYLVLSGFLIRTICLIIVYKYISARLSDRINLKSLVLFDFLFIIYYTFTGIRAFFFKKKQWK